MTGKLILWAQALDNESPDLFDVQGVEIGADDIVRRQEAVSSVSSVVKNGTRVYEASGVLLTADHRRFVLETPAAQRDCAGRTAPIVCCGDYDAAVAQVLGSSVIFAIEAFARRIGRTVKSEHIELARASLEALKKKSETAKRLRLVRIGGATLVVLAIVYWLAQNG